jgi:hypothetical protein
MGGKKYKIMFKIKYILEFLKVLFIKKKKANKKDSYQFNNL